MKFLALLSLALGSVLLQQATAPSPAAASMQRKLDHLQRNGAAEKPDPKPTVLTEDEVNAWMAEGHVKLPKGVNRVRFRGRPGTVTAVANVDFDQMTEGRRSSNPLLMLFRGVHDVEVQAQARGLEGRGMVDVESVSLDGVTIPRAALEFFVNRYVKPKYPNVGLNTRFQMPARIDSAEVGDAKLTLVQK